MGLVRGSLRRTADRPIVIDLHAPDCLAVASAIARTVI